MNERLLIGAKLITSHLIMMILLLWISVISSSGTFLLLSISQTTLLILYLSGYWEFFGMKFKKYYCAAIEICLISLFVWKMQKVNNQNANLYLVVCLSLIQTLLIYVLVKIGIVINERNRIYSDIEFPFKSGSFLITDGGNSKISRLMNYHFYSPTHKKNNTNNSMLYATDIIKLASETSGFLPRSNDRYPIFNENVYSPMDGIIVKIENNIPDNHPFTGNYPYNTGNSVVIRNDNHYLLLGHLRQNSIVVSVGDLVGKNDLLGTAGNSGWTERPHLHMQLMESKSENYWTGKGICIRYGGRNLYKNRIIQI